MSQKILVVDDEPDARELVAFTLRKAGFEVLTAADGGEALTVACSASPDLIVLDVMLPTIGGFEVCKLLRSAAATASVPVILLTAKTAESDRVRGLELGADDYVTKPFSPRELVLRIKGHLRRRQSAAADGEQIRVGDLLIDVPRHQAMVNEQRVNLTYTEFKLLCTLAQSEGRVQSREQLLREVWEYDDVLDTRTVDTHMRRLREKLGHAARHLGTVRGIGYRFIAR